MQKSRHISATIAQTPFPAHQPNDVGADAARGFSGCSLLPRILNAELTVQSAWLTPPPRLTRNKYYISQDSIALRVLLSLACLRAFRLARSVPARAFFVALGFVWCLLYLSIVRAHPITHSVYGNFNKEVYCYVG